MRFENRSNNATREIQFQRHFTKYAAVRVNFPPEVLAASRHASIVADAACVILQKQDFVTGQFFLDEDVLRDEGVTDFSKYAVDASKMPQPDFYVD